MRLIARPTLRIVGLTVVVCLLSTGCVRRRMTIRSNPPGAVVYIDDQLIGTTPVSTSFTYYGTRKFRLVKSGYETLTTLSRMRAPWYQIPPLDFVSENLVGREIRDERVLDFTLQPQRIVPNTELLSRAHNLRDSNAQGFLVPSPNGVSVGQPALGAPGMQADPVPTAPFLAPPQIEPQIITLPPTNAGAFPAPPVN